VSSKSGRRSDGDYEVGYGRPPKATRFGVRKQPDRSSRRSSRKEPADLAALLNRSVRLSRNGKPTKMHAYQAMLYAQVKQALAGKIRALRQVLRLFKEAGLLVAPTPRPAAGACRSTASAAP